MGAVPNRANDNRRRVLITNGDVGTEAQWFGHWATHTPQGMAAVRRAVDAHTQRLGKPAWAETAPPSNYDPRYSKVIYGKKTR